MKVTRFDIEGLLLLEPRVFEDERGYFLESFNELRYNEFLIIALFKIIFHDLLKMFCAVYIFNIHPMLKEKLFL